MSNPREERAHPFVTGNLEDRMSLGGLGRALRIMVRLQR